EPRDLLLAQGPLPDLLAKRPAELRRRARALVQGALEARQLAEAKLELGASRRQPPPEPRGVLRALRSRCARLDEHLLQLGGLRACGCRCPLQLLGRGDALREPTAGVLELLAKPRTVLLKPLDPAVAVRHLALESFDAL